AIAPLVARPEADTDRVAQIFIGQLRLLQAQFLTLIEADRSAKATKKLGGELCDGNRIAAGSRPTRDMAHAIVVGKCPADPAGRRAGLEGLNAFSHVRSGEFRSQQV